MVRPLESRAGLILCALPALLVGGLAFRSGGFFPGETGLAALVVLAAIALRVVFLPGRLRDVGVGVLVACGALALLAAWTLLSSRWSHAPSRALLEYDRTLLYLAVLGLFAGLRRTDRLALGLAVAYALVAAILGALAVTAWCAPDWLHVGPQFARGRLSWPLSYQNAEGVLAAIGCLVALHLASARDVAARIAVPMAAVAPIGAAIIFFSGSRGALVALGVGFLVVLALGDARTLLTGLVATLPAAAVVVVIADGLHGLAVPVPDASAVHDGHAALLQIAVVCLLAGLLRLALVPIDRRLARARRWQPSARSRVAVAAIGLVVLASAVVVTDAPRHVRDGVHSFVTGDSVSASLTNSQRFGTLGNNGRLDHWRVALRHGYEPHPLHGSGAGTFVLLWNRYRPTIFNVVDAHSLYLQMLGELGLVGLALLLLVLGSSLAALLWRARLRAGAWGGLAAAGCAWAAAAGYDWMWEIPAITLPVFAAAGLALARSPEPGPDPEAEPATDPEPDPAAARRRRPWQAAGVVLCAVLAIVPVSAVRSQHDLVSAIQDFRRGDCNGVAKDALASNGAMSSRPEPFELLGYCDVRAGRLTLARRAIASAISRDPDDWEFRYDQAIVEAAAGRDPRPALRAALVRNPREPLLAAARVSFRYEARDAWRARALASPVLVSSASGAATP